MKNHQDDLQKKIEEQVKAELSCYSCANCCPAAYTGHEPCVRRVPVFRTLEPRLLNQIVQLVRRRKFKAGEAIIRPGDVFSKLLIVRNGRVKLLRYGREGEEILIDMLSVGDFYGVDSLFCEVSAEDYLIAAEDARICMIEGADLQELIKKEPEVGLRVIKYYAGLAQKYRRTKEITAIKDTKIRLISYLLYACEERSDDMVYIAQKDLAAALNLTVETVNRRLAELKKADLITQAGQGKIKIEDKKALQNLIS